MWSAQKLRAKQADIPRVQHIQAAQRVREGKRERQVVKARFCSSPTQALERPRQHRLPEQPLAAAAAPKFTKREARAKWLPLAGDASGDLSRGGGGRGMDVGERSGWSCRRVRHGRGPPPARRRPYPLPR
jgi:hypothetical protein